MSLKSRAYNQNQPQWLALRINIEAQNFQSERIYCPPMLFPVEECTEWAARLKQGANRFSSKAHLKMSSSHSLAGHEGNADGTCLDLNVPELAEGRQRRACADKEGQRLQSRHAPGQPSSTFFQVCCRGIPQPA